MASHRLDFRADEELVARVDRLAARLSRPGAKLTRSDATRAALLQGLEVLEREAPAETPAKKGPAPAAKPAKPARK